MSLRRAHIFRRLAGAAVALCVTLAVPAADVGSLKAYEARAVLLFKIAQFTEWPKEAFTNDNAPFVLGILGDDPFKGDIAVVNGKTIKGRPLVVRHCSTPEEGASCHLLFISTSEESRLPKILKALENTSVMTASEIVRFTEDDGMVKLGADKTISGSEKLRFEINRAAADKAKLKINSQLLALASHK
jgi:hypothetical protein